MSSKSYKRPPYLPKHDKVFLPHEGRKGRPPVWPLAQEPTDSEALMWSRLWRLPQAVAWEQANGAYHITVARYACLVSKSNQSASIHGQLTAIEASLGLTPRAMESLNWKVAEPESKPETKQDRQNITAQDLLDMVPDE